MEQRTGSERALPVGLGIVGAGRMGRLIGERAAEAADLSLVACFDTPADQIHDVGRCDVLIDFSHPDNLALYGPQAVEAGTALVIATTGFSGEQIAEIHRLAERVPVVYTANCSVGVTVLSRMCRDLGRVLGDSFDIEIVESHHKGKVDAPSGTAKLLADSVDPVGQFRRVYGRAGAGRRGQEIGIHAVRGGTIAGVHTVLFAGSDEVIELTHRAGSREIFALGALAAARFVVGQPIGLYSMEDVLYGCQPE